MKTRIFLIQFIFLILLTSCKKDEKDKIDEGITFRINDIATNTKSTFVYYNEILGYDSIKYAFTLDESAWRRIEKEITPVVPDPNFGFIVVLNNESIYAATYIQPYSSFARKNILTFSAKPPNFILIELGYPVIPKNEFTGIDLRNDSRLIRRLTEDNKLIEF